MWFRLDCSSCVRGKSLDIVYLSQRHIQDEVMKSVEQHEVIFRNSQQPHCPQLQNGAPDVTQVHPPPRLTDPEFWCFVGDRRCLCGCFYLHVWKIFSTLILFWWSSLWISGSFLSSTVWGLQQSIFTPGEPKDPPEEPHRREAVPVPAPWLPESLQQLQRPRQASAHSPGHGQKSRLRPVSPPKAPQSQWIHSSFTRWQMTAFAVE